MLQCPDVIMTLACDVGDMFIKTQSRIQRYPEQLDRVRELDMSTSDVDSLGRVELRQPLARTKEDSFSLCWIKQQSVLGELPRDVTGTELNSRQFA